MLEKIFKLKENNTTVKKELVAGVITFLTMSYVLIVNPDVLSTTGMDKAALYTTTALATIIGTLLMAFIANLPIAQAPGMGLNSFFAFTVVMTMGYSWQFALTAVLIEGLIFILLTIFNVRELIIKSIPFVLKQAIPVGIGLFIALIGLKNAEIIIPRESTLVSIGNFANHNVWIALLGLTVTGVLFTRKIPGAILIGIIISTIFAFFLGDVKLPKISQAVSLPPSIDPIFMKFTWENVFTLDMLIVVFTFLFVNMFDTIGTLIGVISRTGFADENGDFPQMKRALFADAIGTTVGSCLGTSPVTAYVESAAGVASGGRTGLTSVSVGIMFILALFLAPIFLIVPSAAVSPALIIIGMFMVSSVVKVNFDDMTEALPAFLTMIMMPFTYSIAEGIVFGVLSFVILKLLTGKVKSVSIILIIVSILFVVKIYLDNK